MSDKAMIVNKYGAVEVKEILKMHEDITALKARYVYLENLLAKMSGVDFDLQETHKMHPTVAANYRKLSIERLPIAFKKMKELTSCEDYEYQTTPASTKLIKKVPKGKDA